MNILVIDVGTSSIRGVLYDKTGEVLFIHQIEYQVQYMPNGMAEQSPNDWSDSVYKIVTETVNFCESRSISIGGLSLTSQRSSIIPMGYDDKPLRNAIMWQDKRNAGIVNELAEHQNFVHSLSGARINTVFSGTKMTWFKRNEPELYKKTKKNMHYCRLYSKSNHRRICNRPYIRRAKPSDEYTHKKMGQKFA